MKRGRRVIAGLVACLALSSVSAAAAQSFRVDSVRVSGDGGTDYLTADTATGRVFVSRSTHVMVMDGNTGQVIGDIPNTPRVHGIALVPGVNRGFTTNGGDSTVAIFDLKTLAPAGRVKVATGGLDGIMYDPSTNRIVLTNHSRPKGTAVALDPASGRIVATAELEDDSPEGAASDGKGRIFVNNEGTSTIQVLDAATFAVKGSWPLAPCEGPTGIAYDRRYERIFVGCSDTSVVVDPASGKVVARIPNGAGVDALGWDPVERLIYVPAGRSGNVTVVHQDDADHYRVVATVVTVPGAKTISVNTKTHVVYLFQPEYGPAPAPPPGSPPPAPGSRPPRGPVIGAWFLILRH
jgi:DNA-binding beta-propeller fold protein YncE